MRISELEDKLKRDASLPMLPQVVVKVQKVVAKDDSSAKDLANVILSDPSLTSRLLKLVNSAFYAASRQKVTRVTQAIVVLGFEKVRNLALALSSYKILKNLSGGKILKEFWLHSLSTAVASQALAQLQRRTPPEEAFVGGLLHDVGKLILAHYNETDYRRVVDEVIAGKSYLEAEKEIFQIDHRDAGLALAKTWRFPPLIEAAIRYHHDLAKGSLRGEELDIMGVVGVANLIAKNLYGRHAERRKHPVEQIVEKAEELLGLTQVDVDNIAGKIGEMVDQVAESLGISIAELKRFAEKGYDKAMLSDDDTAMIEMDQELNLERRRLRAMYEISSMLTQDLPLQDFLRQVLVHVCEAFEFERAFFATVSQKERMIKGTAAHGPQASEICPKIQAPLEEDAGIIALTALKDRAYNVLDIFNTDLPILKDERIEMLFGTKNLVTLPVHVGQAVVAVLILNNCQRTTLITEKDVEALKTVANQMGFAIEKASLKKKA